MMILPPRVPTQAARGERPGGRMLRRMTAWMACGCLCGALGAATFDERVEISRTTGGVTHRIAPDIDGERNKLVADAVRAGALDG